MAKKPVTIRFDYFLPNFVKKVGWEFKGFPIKILDKSFDNLRLRYASGPLKGTIKIDLVKIDLTPLVVGYSKRTYSYPVELGGTPLPQATFGVVISLLPNQKNLHSTLRYYKNKLRKYDWKRAISEEKSKELMDKPMFQEMLNDLPQILEGILPETEEVPNGDLLGQVMKVAMPIIIGKFLTSYVDEQRRERDKRRIIYQDFLKRLEDDEKLGYPVDLKVLKEFGRDLFRIFRHYMNQIISYLKFEYQQTWMEEVPETDDGYFYFEQDVKLVDNDVQFVPYLHHSHKFLLLDADLGNFLKNNWNDFLQAAQSNLLGKYGEVFSYNRIFTLSYLAVMDYDLETAHVLTQIPLEAVVTDLIELLQQKDAGKASKLSQARTNGGLREVLKQLDNVIGLSSSLVKYKRVVSKTLELISLRNDVIHKKKTISPTVDNRKKSVERVRLTQKLTLALIQWIRNNIEPAYFEIC